MQGNEEVFELTDKQRKAFKALEKAYSDCLKSGIYFANNYGTLLPYDSAMVKRYDGEESATSVCSRFAEPSGLKIENEWADDIHYVHLTEKGWKLYNSTDD